MRDAPRRCARRLGPGGDGLRAALPLLSLPQLWNLRWGGRRAPRWRRTRSWEPPAGWARPRELGQLGSLGSLGAWENRRWKTGIASATPDKVRESWRTPGAELLQVPRSRALSSYIVGASQWGAAREGLGCALAHGAWLTMTRGPRRCPAYSQMASVNRPHSVSLPTQHFRRQPPAQKSSRQA